jgi:arylsulfatase A-like enzyme
MALTFGMITMIDDAVGRLIKRLKALGLDDNTVIVFTADHGDYMGDHGVMLKLLLHFQGLIRVPFVWREPGNSEIGRRTDLGSSIDIAPTILARAGVQPYNGIQGRDLFHSESPEGVLVEEDSARQIRGYDRFQRLRTLVTGDWRMTLRQDEAWSEMYNLRDDPYEMNNLYDDPQHRGQRDAMTEQLLRHIIAHQDYAPLPSMRA